MNVINDETKEQLRGRLREYVESITQHSKNGFYVCPICHSGTGKNHTGAFRITDDGKRWTCFAHDGGGDIFDLIGAVENIDSYPDRVRRAAEIFNVSIDNDTHRATHSINHNTNYDTNHNSTHKEEHKAMEDNKQERDYTAYFLEANKHLSDTEYHRGISIETLNKFKVGYDENWKYPNEKGKNKPATKRLIIPTSKYSYLARATDKMENGEKLKVGAVHLFNTEALNSDGPVFVVEGEIDAMSIVDMGQQAIGLGSTSNVDKLVSYLKNTEKKPLLILALDNDDTGKKATEKLENELKAIHAPYFVPEVMYGEYKDANEYLMKDRDGLKLALDIVVRQTLEPDMRAIDKTRASNYIKEFWHGITESVNTPYYPTGFDKLDKVLDGGFYEGLYVIGAVSGLGKTTLVMQIADHIAKEGKDVLIISLEMARTELMARSISRLTYELDADNAKTVRQITTGKKWKYYSKAEMELIQKAVDKYGEYADHLFIREGIMDMGLREIRDALNEHKRATGHVPIVVVDYLQIMAPIDVRDTDKRNMDKAVKGLKQMSRDFKTPIIAISAINRASYGQDNISMASFKESGGIEYSSDVLLGMNYASKADDTADEKDIVLEVLKNRNGKKGVRIKYAYEAPYFYFEEI